MPKTEDPGACSFPGCGRPVQSSGLCSAHYNQQRRGEELRPARTARGSGGQVVFRLDLERIAEVEKLAAEEGIAASEWYRRAVDERIERKAKKR